MTNEESFYSLVMPFVTVKSKGGPHDDESYTIGYLCGYLDRLLETGDTALLDRCVQTSAVPQLDLIAMRHGYSIESKVWEDSSDWTFIKLTRKSTNVITER
jgi:hypothetical protein